MTTRAALFRNTQARKIVLALEKVARRRLRVEATDEISEFDPNDFTIRIGPRSWISRMGNWTWPNRLLYHELGHAVTDVFYQRFDRRAFGRLFVGPATKRYREGKEWVTKTNFKEKRDMLRRPSVTAYGKLHPDEAWAEAFSFALGNVDDRVEDAAVIRQLAYADWIIENIVSGARSWGSFQMPTSEVDCTHCGCTFDFEDRHDRSSHGWCVECPRCHEDSVLRE